MEGCLQTGCERLCERAQARAKHVQERVGKSCTLPDKKARCATCEIHEALRTAAAAWVARLKGGKGGERVQTRERRGGEVQCNCGNGRNRNCFVSARTAAAISGRGCFGAAGRTARAIVWTGGRDAIR